jgi:hypothetical protein
MWPEPPGVEHDLCLYEPTEGYGDARAWHSDQTLARSRYPALARWLDSVEPFGWAAMPFEGDHISITATHLRVKDLSVCDPLQVVVVGRLMSWLCVSSVVGAHWSKFERERATQNLISVGRGVGCVELLRWTDEACYACRRITFHPRLAPPATHPMPKIIL